MNRKQRKKRRAHNIRWTYVDLYRHLNCIEAELAVKNTRMALLLLDKLDERADKLHKYSYLRERRENVV